MMRVLHLRLCYLINQPKLHLLHAVLPRWNSPVRHLRKSRVDGLPCLCPVGWEVGVCHVEGLVGWDDGDGCAGFLGFNYRQRFGNRLPTNDQRPIPPSRLDCYWHCIGISHFDDLGMHFLYGCLSNIISLLSLLLFATIPMIIPHRPITR